MNAEIQLNNLKYFIIKNQGMNENALGNDSEHESVGVPLFLSLFCFGLDFKIFMLKKIVSEMCRIGQ